MTDNDKPVLPTEIIHIVEGFSDLSLPAEEWTHEAHLITGLSLLIENGLAQAEEMMPDMIRTYNEAKGGINSDTDGYHHTITIFYLRALENFRSENEALDGFEMTRKMLVSPVAEKMYPLRYYSKELLFSVKARRQFVAPDVKEFG